MMRRLHSTLRRLLVELERRFDRLERAGRDRLGAWRR
jgi:hypothetical protein